MAWLLGFAIVFTVIAVAFVVVLSFAVIRDRRRRRATTLSHSADNEVDHVDVGATESGDLVVNEAAACIQVWLDGQWDQRFGRGLSDSSGSVET